MTTVGELFISLGVKGADKTIGAINSVKDGLKGIASTSLETKAAIIGAIYALEKLFQASGKRGTALENFSVLTGMATKTVQQYQWAAQQVGISNEEVTGTFVSLQKIMTKTLLGEGAPKGLAMVSKALGGTTEETLANWQKNPEQELLDLQKYAATEKNAALRNEVLESMGLSANMISGIDRKAFTPQNLAKAPTYSDEQIGQLDKANVGWANLGTKVEMIFGKLNAAHGVGFINDITKLVEPLSKIIESLVKFAEKIKLFDGLSAIFNGMAKAIDLLASSLEKLGNSKFLDTFMKTMGDSFALLMKTVSLQDTTKESAAVGKDLSPVTNLIKSGANAVTEKASSYDWGGDFKSFGAMIGLGSKESKPVMNQSQPIKTAPQRQQGAAFTPAAPLKLVPPMMPDVQKSIAPTAPPPSNNNSTQNINVNQNLNFQHDGSNAKQTGKSVKESIQGAFRQIPALAQGS